MNCFSKSCVWTGDLSKSNSASHFVSAEKGSCPPTIEDILMRWNEYRRCVYIIIIICITGCRKDMLVNSAFRKQVFSVVLENMVWCQHSDCKYRCFWQRKGSQSPWFNLAGEPSFLFFWHNYATLSVGTILAQGFVLIRMVLQRNLVLVQSCYAIYFLLINKDRFTV